MGILASASARLAEGEVMQLLTANDTETGESAYLDVIKAKTAKLFAASCRLGAIVADRPSVEEEGPLPQHLVCLRLSHLIGRRRRIILQFLL